MISPPASWVLQTHGCRLWNDEFARHGIPHRVDSVEDAGDTATLLGFFFVGFVFFLFIECVCLFLVCRFFRCFLVFCSVVYRFLLVCLLFRVVVCHLCDS